MSYRTYNISHSKADGFQIRFIEQSRFKTMVSVAAGGFCAATGHHFCNSRILNAMLLWPDKDEKVLAVIPTTREVADKVTWGGVEAWSWVDIADGEVKL